MVETSAVRPESHGSLEDRGRALLLLVASTCVLTGGGCSAAPDARQDEITASAAEAVTGAFAWKGYTWNPTTGGMAGILDGDPANVVVDSSGYLHLKITKTGSQWSAAEVFTTTKLGFGTYQWQIAGPIDRMDHNVVLGLYPYGPAAGIGSDGTNEIDTEFSFWNDELPNVNVDWGVYPPTKAGKHWERDFEFSLNGGNATTARLEWTKAGIVGTLMSGFQPIGSTGGLLSTYTYAPSDPTADVPQQALPLGMNLWCYKAVPADGQNLDIVLQDFQFVPEGSGGDAGTGATGTDGGTAGSGATTGGSGSGSASSGSATVGPGGSVAGSGSVIAGPGGGAAPSSSGNSASAATSGGASAASGSGSAASPGSFESGSSTPSSPGTSSGGSSTGSSGGSWAGGNTAPSGGCAMSGVRPEGSAEGSFALLGFGIVAVARARRRNV